ncbi:hypothetical protein OF364_01525 [Mycoplasma enhydrae]|uniref:HinT-interacting membrane complex lipoprotein P60 n=1 Tax=Mycoplasma enhydrae TaxID=2499220 RepID=UPI0021E8BFB0|nr:hypothetical protein [Mycoplasma enhydrae]MCV3733909.1 hypothetical protein [Mycoplasma enhydrae]MCV3753492.1 hypothetical protein [Mycoplasma enhydrae]
MKKINKILWVLAPSATVLPIAAISASCGKTDNSTKKETPGFQSGFLKEATSKNQILLSIVNTYLGSFYQEEIKLLPEANRAPEKDPVLALINNKTSQFHKDIYNIFKFYANKEVDSNPQFFWNIKNDFVKLNIDTTQYNPEIGKLPSEDEFIFLMNNSKFLAKNIRLQLEKLLVAKIYLLKSREEYKKLSLNDKGLDKYQVSLEKEMKKDSTSSTKKDIYNALDFSASNLYLIKYLVENSLIQKWSFSDDQNMDLREGKTNVKSFEDFNNLARYNPSEKPKFDYNPAAKHPEYILKTGASENYDLKNLRAYNGIITNKESSGDLSTSIYTIQRHKSPIFGFLDPKTQKVYDQDHFKFREILKTADKWPALLASAQLKAKQDKVNKDTSFSAKDVEFIGLVRDTKNEKLFTKTVVVNSIVYTLQFEINSSIKFTGEKDGVLRVPVTLNIKELAKRHEISLNIDLEYKTNKFIDQTEGKKYNLDKLPAHVTMISKDGKKIEAAYVVKIAPSYLKKSIKDNEGKTKEKSIFSLEETPWNYADQQDILANHIVLTQGDTLFREVNKYITGNLGFKLESQNKTISDILKTEGWI